MWSLYQQARVQNPALYPLMVQLDEYVKGRVVPQRGQGATAGESLACWSASLMCGIGKAVRDGWLSGTAGTGMLRQPGALGSLCWVMRAGGSRSRPEAACSVVPSGSAVRLWCGLPVTQAP